MEKHHHHDGDDAGKWQKREHYRHQYTPDSYAQKAAFRHASNSLGFAGVTGHLVRTGGILAPLIIGKFVKDPEKKWKAIRMSAVVAAVISEVLYGLHHNRDKQECREDHEAHHAELQERLQAALSMGAGMGMGR